MKRKLYAIYDGTRLVAVSDNHYRIRRLKGYGYTVLRAIWHKSDPRKITTYSDVG